MIHQVKAFAAKPDDLKSITGPQGGRRQSISESVLWLPRHTFTKSVKCEKLDCHFSFMDYYPSSNTHSLVNILWYSTQGSVTSFFLDTQNIAVS